MFVGMQDQMMNKQKMLAKVSLDNTSDDGWHNLTLFLLEYITYFKFLCITNFFLNTGNIKQMIRFSYAVGVNGIWHHLADPVQGPSGPIHPPLKEPLSLMPRDKQHLDLTQQVLEVNLGLELCPVRRRKFCFLFQYWQVRKRQQISNLQRQKRAMEIFAIMMSSILMCIFQWIIRKTVKMLWCTITILHSSQYILF